MLTSSLALRERVNRDVIVALCLRISQDLTLALKEPHLASRPPPQVPLGNTPVLWVLTGRHSADKAIWLLIPLEYSSLPLHRPLPYSWNKWYSVADVLTMYLHWETSSYCMCSLVWSADNAIPCCCLCLLSLSACLVSNILIHTFVHCFFPLCTLKFENSYLFFSA